MSHIQKRLGDTTAVTGRFWGEGPYGAAPDHTLDSIILSVSAGPTTLLSLSEDTKVEFKVSGADVLVADKVRVWALRVDLANEQAKFYDFVKKGHDVDLVTNAGAAITDGILKQPTVKSLVGVQTTMSFHVDFTQIAAGEQYYFAVIINNSTDDLYTAYISGLIQTGDAPIEPIIPTLLDQQLSDRAFSNIGGNILATVQERIRSYFEVDSAGYDTDIQALYGSGSYDDQLSNLVFTVRNAANNEVLFQTELADGEIVQSTPGAGVRRYDIVFRLRHDEPDGAGKVQSWEGLDLVLEWQQVLFLPASLTGRADDHFDRVFLEQYIEVRDYENDTGFNTLDSIVVEDASGNPITRICDEETGNLFITVTKTDPDPFLVLAMIDSRFYSFENIEEESTYGGPTPPDGITESTSLKLDNVPASFPTNSVTFEVVTSELNMGGQYRVSLVAKKAFPP